MCRGNAGPAEMLVECRIFTSNEAGLGFFRSQGYEVERGLCPVGKELRPGGAPSVRPDAPLDDGVSAQGVPEEGAADR